jgi:GNAT superfamily N-acetyltransferase
VEVTRDGYLISDDAARLDAEAIHRWLSRDAYWSLGRSAETMRSAIAGSVNFGLYAPDGVQVGYARAVTDRATFAWLCDVYVDRGARGTGLGTWFVGTVCDEIGTWGARRVLLATRDAHGLYARFGFRALLEPERWMELRRPEPGHGV